jgi:acyl-CoA synthetase (AMP-forming)/AMP-acid ligase II
MRESDIMTKSNKALGLPFQTLVEALAAAPADSPFVTMWKSETDIEKTTFGAFRQQAQAHAQYFRSLGAKAGDTVILIMPQGIQLMSAFMGAMLFGVIPTILAYPNFKVEPAKYRYGLAGMSANLKAALIIVDEGFPEDLMSYVAVQKHSRLVRCERALPSQPWSETDHSVEADQLAFIQHSAGTTGLQKGVALTHGAVLRQIRHLAPAIGLSLEDRIYSWLPLYHDMGLIACFMLPLVCHVPLVMQAPTDWVIQPRTMLELMSTERCTLAWTPNFALQFLARRVRPEDCASLDLSCVRALINCSEPVRASSMDEFDSAFSSHGLRPSALQSCYAMAETVFAATQSDVMALGPCRLWVDAKSLRKQRLVCPVSSDAPGATCLVSSGRPLPNTKIRIVPEAGDKLGAGMIGEIVIQCESMLDGYYNRPDLTEKAIRDGWYWSGDLGFLSGDELYVIGRKKDMIIVAGENIYPQDIEEIVSAHQAIYDGRVVAFGNYNSSIGTEEIVVVAEVRNSRDLENAPMIERELRSTVKVELGVAVGHFFIKPPRWVVKSTAGKTARTTTREKLYAEHPNLQSQGGTS